MIDRIACYIGQDTDPYRNLAREKFLAETVEKGVCILYLWQNRQTVVIGRNQNAWQECRTTQLQKDGGFLARRLSGGGAVYHDLGNLNFTFCLKKEDYDLKKQQSVIIAACRSLGIPAEISGRNDLVANGAKFSGNSFYSHEDHAFHNGTLLLHADMERLGKYLSPSKIKLESKGVASVRSRVVNLCEIKPDLTVEAMEKAFIDAFQTVYGMKAKELTDEVFAGERFRALEAFFSDWEWNYGSDRPFAFTCEGRYPWGGITLKLNVAEGVCTDAAVYTDSMDAEFALPLKEALIGSRFETGMLCQRINGLSACREIASDLCMLIQTQDI